MPSELQISGSGGISELLRKYRGYLHFMASVQIDRRLRGKVDPSDLVQETMLQAQQKFAQFRGSSERELLGSLRTVLATQLAQQVRRFSTQKRDVSLEQQLQHELVESSNTLTRQLAVSTSESKRERHAPRDVRVGTVQITTGPRP